jgi:hypothetical protein
MTKIKPLLVLDGEDQELYVMPMKTKTATGRSQRVQLVTSNGETPESFNLVGGQKIWLKKPSGSSSLSAIKGARQLMIPRQFEAQYWTDYATTHQNGVDLVTRSDYLITINLAEVSSLLPNLKTFLYLCPRKLTEALTSWKFNRELPATAEISSRHRELYQFFRDQIQASNGELVQTKKIALFSVVYNASTNFSASATTEYSPISAVFARNLPDLSISNYRQILPTLETELSYLKRYMKLREFSTQSSAFIHRLQTRTLPNVTAETPAYDKQPMNAALEMEFLSLLCSQEAIDNPAYRKIQTFGEALVIENTEYILNIDHMIRGQNSQAMKIKQQEKVKRAPRVR